MLEGSKQDPRRDPNLQGAAKEAEVGGAAERQPLEVEG